MTAYNLNEIELALINDLRHHITDPLSRGSSTTDLFNGNNTTKIFTLSQTAISVEPTVNGVIMKYGTEYTINSGGTDITFSTAPSTGTNNVSIALKYGITWVYPDFNKTNITITDFPRISISAISTNTQPNAIGGANFKTSLIISATIAGKTRQQINSLINLVRERLLNNAKSFGLFTIIEPSAESALSDSALHQRIMQRTIDFFIPYKFEVVA